MIDLASYVPLGDKESSSFFDEHRAHRTVRRLRGLLHRNDVAARSPRPQAPPSATTTATSST